MYNWNLFETRKWNKTNPIEKCQNIQKQTNWSNLDMQVIQSSYVVILNLIHNEYNWKWD